MLGVILCQLPSVSAPGEQKTTKSSQNNLQKDVYLYLRMGKLHQTLMLHAFSFENPSELRQESWSLKTPIHTSKYTKKDQQTTWLKHNASCLAALGTRHLGRLQCDTCFFFFFFSSKQVTSWPFRGPCYWTHDSWALQPLEQVIVMRIWTIHNGSRLHLARRVGEPTSVATRCDGLLVIVVLLAVPWFNGPFGPFCWDQVS